MGQKSIVWVAILIIAVLYQNCAEYTLQDAPEQFRKISLKVVSYCPSEGKTLSEVFVSNHSSVFENKYLVTDTDRDGLSDNFESILAVQTAYNIDPTRAQTAGLGYRDAVFYVLGLQTDNQEATETCPDSELDTDLDLLNDCEENLLDTDRLNPDTDKDGIPDGLEIRHRLNPGDDKDAIADIDGDGTLNIDEIIFNLPVHTLNTVDVNSLRLNYQIEQQADGCYTMHISNIPIVGVNNGNEVQLMIIEKEMIAGEQEVFNIRYVNLIVSRLFPTGLEIDIPEVSNQTTVVAPEGSL
jgi:hypothetical protein